MAVSDQDDKQERPIRPPAGRRVIAALGALAGCEAIVAGSLAWQAYGSRPTLIDPNDTWTLWAVILLGAGASIYLEQTYRWAARMSGPVLGILAAMILSNLKVLPTESPVYDTVSQYLVPVALPLLLFRANVLKIIRVTGPMFVAFHVATLGTVLGAVLAAWLFRDAFPRVAEVAGIMTGSYVGGAVNFLAIKEIFQVGSDLANPLIVADNVVMAGLFAVLLLMSAMPFFLRRYAHPHSIAESTDQLLAASYWRRKEIALVDLAKSLAIAVGIAAASFHLAAAVGRSGAPALVREVFGNLYVNITWLSLAVATLFGRRLEAIAGSDELGALLLYVFFFVIGCPADLVAVVRNVPAMFLFCLTIAAVNLAVTMLLGRLLRLNLEDLLLSVNATLGGPATAAAMAIAKGWHRLVLPAVLVGIWGYVIGTPLGVFLARFLTWVLGPVRG